MLNRLFEFSVRQRVFVLLATLVMVGIGVRSALRLPIDAVPDITNVQVQINTAVPAYAPEEIEKLVGENVENAGGSVIQLGGETVTVRAVGRVQTPEKTSGWKSENNPRTTRQQNPLRVKADRLLTPQLYTDQNMNFHLNAIGLFAVTALAEIFGCYTFYLWLTLKKSPLWLVPGVASLALFAWLLTLHPTAAGRTYAAYGGIYIAASLAWLKFVDGQSPDRWDVLGALVCLIGAAIILLPHIKTVTSN